MAETEREQRDELIDRLVHINRISKVIKGGRRFSFAALVVVGDQRGRTGYGHGKAREVPEAIRKATEFAKRKMIRVALREGRTLHHDIEGRAGAGRALLRPAPPGTGIIAGGPMRAVFETLGVQDVVVKSLGSSNPYNMVCAVFDALSKQSSPAQVARRRGKKVSEILGQRMQSGGRPETRAEDKKGADKKTQSKKTEGKKSSDKKASKEKAAKKDKDAVKKPPAKKAAAKNPAPKKEPAKEPVKKTAAKKGKGSANG